MTDASDYHPAACGVYDELGLRMMRCTPCRLVVEGDHGSETLRPTIENLYTQGDAEYVWLEDARFGSTRL